MVHLGPLAARTFPRHTVAHSPTHAHMQARKAEDWCVARWTTGGITAPPHPLVPDGNYSRFVLGSGQQSQAADK